MSNNKQSMKLYTEEQVRKAFIAGMEFIAVDPLKYEQDAHEYISELSPIQLPSDEEIVKDSKYKSLAGIGWIEGAKWMRDKIQGGIK